MTAYKREGIPTFKGGHNQGMATASKRKAAMAAFDEALSTSRKVFTLPANGHTRSSSGAVISLRASSSSSHGHSRVKLACQLTLLLYHTWSLSTADPQFHRATSSRD